MKKITILITFIYLTSGFCFGQNEITVRKELNLLQPFLNKSWSSEEMHPSGEMKLHFTRSYELMHAGKIIKYQMECKELKIQIDGYFYYDSNKKEIAFLHLSSNGNISTGNVKEEDGKLLFYGHTIFPNKKIEYKNIMEVNSKGEVMDQFFSFEEGKWKAGHSRVWTGR